MKINYQWLQEIVPLDVPPAQLGRDLTTVGLALESLEESGVVPVLDLDITSNRADCLCHVGVAREVAAIYGMATELPDCTIPALAGDPIPYAVEILAPKLCRRYCGLLLTDVRIGPSPQWLQDRLNSVGQRPVNNVVDATNYVLLELGHPLHAFDLQRLSGPKIIVRQAVPGEFIQTLDGFKHELLDPMLVIADSHHPVALAGIMGGEESEISATTTRILLEAAHFNPVSVRRTARRLGMKTEASYRFERGVDVENAPRAIGRCARLILEIAGGRVASPLLDAYPGKRSPRHVTFHPRSLKRLLGANIDHEFAAAKLQSLGFELERKRGRAWKATVPTFREDVEMEADLVEEVARHYGYDRIPASHNLWSGIAAFPVWKKLEEEIGEALRAWGYSEAVNTSFTTSQELEQFPGYEGSPVSLLNPLSEEETRLRWNILPMLLRNCRHNFNFGIKNLRLFEKAKSYFQNAEGKVDEQKRLGMLLTGSTAAVHWDANPREIDIFDLKGQICSLLKNLGVTASLQSAVTPPPYFNSGLCLTVNCEDGLVGHLGRLHHRIEESYKFRQPIWVCDLDMEMLWRHAAPESHFRPLPKYPTVLRDISFVIDQAVQYNTIEKALLSCGIQELQDFELIDIYRLQGSEEGKISLTIRLTYQSLERTLIVEEVNNFDRRIVQLLQEAVGASLRS